MATRAVVFNGGRKGALHLGLAIAAMLLLFAGFSRTYFLREHFGSPPLRPLLHLHGAVFTAWFLLLIAQVGLVAARRTDLHRRLGVAGGLLAALMLIVGTATAISAASLGRVPAPGIPPLVFLAVPLFDMIVFPALVFTALYFRRKPEIHKRLMVVATISILPPAIARLPPSFIHADPLMPAFIIPDLILVALAASDTIRHRRLHPAFLWGGALFIVSFPLRLMVSGTEWWLAFARWLTS